MHRSSSRLPLVIGLAALMGVAPAEASSSDFCPALKRIVAAAVETPTFRSVAKEAKDGRSATLLLQGTTNCSVSSSTIPAKEAWYRCDGALNLTEEQVKSATAALQADVRACLGSEGYEPDFVHRHGGSNERIYEVPQKGKTVSVSVLADHLRLPEYRRASLTVRVAP